MKKYTLDSKSITKWHTDTMSKYRIYGKLEDLLKKDYHPITIKKVGNKGNGYIIPKAENETVRKEHYQINKTYAILCEINMFKMKIDELTQQSINSIGVREYEKIEGRITQAKSKIEVAFNTLDLNTKKLFKNELLSLLPNQDQLELETIKEDNRKYFAKHFVLTYLIECKAKNEVYPIGQKKKLELIGNKRMGKGKGNRFYKVFNEIINKDLNIESSLIEVGGENWRETVLSLSNDSRIVEEYLLNKQL